MLFVFMFLSHARRRIVHVNVTAHRTAAWAAQQLREAWPWTTAPHFLIRDRDGIYGSDHQQVAQAMGIDELATAPRSPWQNPIVERVIGSLRRECLDHVIVLNERALRRHLQQYLAYCHGWRMPRAAPDRYREVQPLPAGNTPIVQRAFRQAVVGARCPTRAPRLFRRSGYRPGRSGGASRDRRISVGHRSYSIDAHTSLNMYSNEP